jgi:S-methylmethionine-dependent homocysteine/selenocysteine methylase
MIEFEKLFRNKPLFKMKCMINSTALTDGGLETDMIFNHGINLPYFAAFPLVEDPGHQDTLKKYYREYLEIAKKNKTAFILESPTWRANPDWGHLLGYDKKQLEAINHQAIQQLSCLKKEYENSIDSIYISGQIGPRGDGYQVAQAMNSWEAMDYHYLQVKAFKKAKVNMVTAITMTYSNEALGIVRAAQKEDIPVVISFTVELDGNLPSGESLEYAITRLDDITNCYPAYYMINCAHPTHFINRLISNGSWKLRIKGVRVNASCKCHAELDEAPELDTGNRKELGLWHKILKCYLPNLMVYGGCCGTDASHVTAICDNILN